MSLKNRLYMRNLLLIIIFLPCACLGYKFDKNSTYDVCFTPGEKCTQKIVDKINLAEKQILVQAYSFTSTPIAKALAMAKQRGVNVTILLDKRQVKVRYSLDKYFCNQNIPVFIDYLPAIAHNKVIIIDGHLLITGSFNFTKAAQSKNAENVLIVDDRGLAEKYEQNWGTRKQASIKEQEYLWQSKYGR
jgi:phosphatidylserine/phosphatidylglycerophosphate/cardiolipin synthase-like enzyme